MSEAMKPTPGVWSVEFCEGTGWYGEAFDVRVYTDDFLICAADVTYSEYPESKDEIKANFNLFAEAGTVFHETGLSPRQIMEQRDELLAIATNGHADVLGLPCGDLLAAANILRNHGADELARRLEDKHELECAAIAKCEEPKP